MASNQKVTNLTTALQGAGYITAAPTSGSPWPLNGPYSFGQVEEIVNLFRAANIKFSLQPMGTLPSITLTPAATLTGHLVITQTARSFAAGQFVTVSVADAAVDNLASPSPAPVPLRPRT